MILRPLVVSVVLFHLTGNNLTSDRRLVAPSAFQSISDLEHCQGLANAVTHAWVIPYIGLMGLQASSFDSLVHFPGLTPSSSVVLDIVQGRTVP